MKNLMVVIAILLGIVSLSTACEPPGPLCNCVCPEISPFPEIPPCPNVTLNCSPNSNTLPGLWVVKFKGSEKCGKVTVYPDQMIIEDQFKSLTWMIIDKKLFLQQVESCQ